MIDLTALLEDPTRADKLPGPLRQRLVRQCAALIIALEAAEAMSNPNGIPDKALTVDEAARRIGISPHTLRKRLQSDKPPAYAKRIGRRWVCSERAIDKWLGGTR